MFLLIREKHLSTQNDSQETCTMDSQLFTIPSLLYFAVPQYNRARGRSPRSYPVIIQTTTVSGMTPTFAVIYFYYFCVTYRLQSVLIKLLTIFHNYYVWRVLLYIINIPRYIIDIEVYYYMTIQCNFQELSININIIYNRYYNVLILTRRSYIT